MHDAGFAFNTRKRRQGRRASQENWKVHGGWSTSTGCLSNAVGSHAPDSDPWHTQTLDGGVEMGSAGSDVRLGADVAAGGPGRLPARGAFELKEEEQLARQRRI